MSYFEYFTSTDRKNFDMLPGRTPQVTFSCDRMSSTCKFQFWTATFDTFYCSLEECTSETQTGYEVTLQFMHASASSAHVFPGGSSADKMKALVRKGLLCQVAIQKFI
jgi:hypothetical protein